MSWKDHIEDFAGMGRISLTSKRLILRSAKLHMFRSSEQIEHSYSLSSIDHIEITKQPKNSRDGSGYECRVYLNRGTIELYSPEYERFAPFVNALNTEITGDPNPLVGPKQTLVSDVANALGNVTSQFSTTFRKNMSAQTKGVVERVSIPCSGCGALLNGWHGKTVFCEYCGGERQL